MSTLHDRIESAEMLNFGNPVNYGGPYYQNTISVIRKSDHDFFAPYIRAVRDERKRDSAIIDEVYALPENLYHRLFFFDGCVSYVVPDKSLSSPQLLHKWFSDNHKILIGPQCKFSEDQKKLIIGNEYTVRKTQLNSSSSYVWLEEFPNESGDENSAPFFSLAAFEWTPPPFEPHDLIGLPGRSVLRLTDKYPIGIYINGTKACEGDPMIAITCDMKTETVTDAVWYETYLNRKAYNNQ